jgi:hypothetical protein
VMPLVMEQDVALDPVDIGLFGPNGIVFDSDSVTDLIKELLGTFFHFPTSHFALAFLCLLVYTNTTQA